MRRLLERTIAGVGRWPSNPLTAASSFSWRTLTDPAAFVCPARACVTVPASLPTEPSCNACRAACGRALRPCLSPLAHALALARPIACCPSYRSARGPWHAIHLASPSPFSRSLSHISPYHPRCCPSYRSAHGPWRLSIAPPPRLLTFSLACTPPTTG